MPSSSTSASRSPNSRAARRHEPRDASAPATIGVVTAGRLPIPVRAERRSRAPVARFCRSTGPRSLEIHRLTGARHAARSRVCSDHRADGDGVPAHRGRAPTPRRCARQSDAMPSVPADGGRRLVGGPRSSPGPHGHIPVRIYQPLGVDDASKPGIVYFHGGGWVICDLDTHDGACRRLANELGARGVGRLPPRTRAQVPGRGRRLLRRAGVGGGARRRARHRPRRGSPSRATAPAATSPRPSRSSRPRPQRPAARVPAPRLPGHRLVGHAQRLPVEGRQRHRVLPHDGPDGVVPRAVPPPTTSRRRRPVLLAAPRRRRTRACRPRASSPPSSTRCATRARHYGAQLEAAGVTVVRPPRAGRVPRLLQHGRHPRRRQGRAAGGVRRDAPGAARPS